MARRTLGALTRRETNSIPLFQRVVLELQSHCNRDCFFCSREPDRLGKRKTVDGTSIRQALPTEKVHGDACCCCEDMYGELLEHNVFAKSIREIWHSERHLEVVRTLGIGDRGAFDLCAKCTMAPSRYVADPKRGIRNYDR